MDTSAVALFRCIIIDLIIELTADVLHPFTVRDRQHQAECKWFWNIKANDLEQTQGPCRHHE